MDNVTEAVSDETNETTLPPVAPPKSRFGDDDLGRLQTILLGDHAEQTADRIDTLEQALLGVLDDLRAEMNERLDGIESRLSAEADTRSKALGNLASRVDDESTERSAALKDLTSDLRSTETDILQAIDAASSTAQNHVDELRTATAAASTELKSSKVDRSVLVDLLANAVEGLRTSDD